VGRGGERTPFDIARDAMDEKPETRRKDQGRSRKPFTPPKVEAANYSSWRNSLSFFGRSKGGTQDTDIPELLNEKADQELRVYAEGVIRRVFCLL